MSPSRGSLEPSADDWDTLLIVTVFSCIALYNFLELNAIIFTTFKRRSGLYFWSFLTSTNGIAPYAIGFLLKNLRLSPSRYIDVTLIVIGWVCMVTGQSFVLYSRLHIVLRDQEKLRLIRTMIIVNAFICSVPSVILIYGSNSASPDHWAWPYQIFERVQVTIFFIQETILSGIYIYRTLSFFRAEAALRGKAAANIMMQLVWINILIIFLDMTIIVLEYASFYNIQTAIKAFVYSVKLKLEFSVLNGLVELTKSGGSSARNMGGSMSCENPCCCAGVHHAVGGSSGGIYDGTDPRNTVVDFETFNETMTSRLRDCGKSERAESAYEVRIFADGHAGEPSGSGSSESANPGSGGITIHTETEVSVQRMEDWDPSAWPGLDALESGSRPVTRGSRVGSCRQSSEIEFARR